MLHPLTAPAFKRIHKRGSSLLTALLTMTVLTFVAATVVSKVGVRYQSTFHSSSWEEALLAAEAGVDLAMLSVNKVATDPTGAWAGWSAPDAAGVRSRTYGPATNPPLVPHIGEGNTKLHASVRVDPMIGGRRTWYRIRSRGTAELPGTVRSGVERSLRDESGAKNYRTMLRKLSFFTDRTSGALKAPQVSRNIEIMATEASTALFLRALTVKNEITLGPNVIIDSYDSRDAAKSTLGKWDILKRQSNGDVATNVNGSLSNLGAAQVYGDALSNGGTFVGGTGVKGLFFNNFSTEFPPVKTPVWSYLSPGPISVAGTTILTAGTAAAPSHYKLSSIALAASQTLTVKNPTPGTDTFVEIWVTGNITTSGQSSIILEPGVRAVFHIEGNSDISGGGIINQGKPEHLLIKGVTPADPAVTPFFTYRGNGALNGVIYAPSSDVNLTGNGAISGAVVGKKAYMTGNGGFHYDEALSTLDIGGTGGYQVASWVEDVR